MVMQRLRTLREDRGLTQTDISKVLGITQKAYSNYETGQRAIPLGSLIKMARYFGTSTDYLLGMTDKSKPYK